MKRTQNGSRSFDFMHKNGCKMFFLLAPFAVMLPNAKEERYVEAGVNSHASAKRDQLNSDACQQGSWKLKPIPVFDIVPI